MNKSENNKRIAKNTLLLYFRMFMIMGVSLYTSRIILSTLGIVDFGIYNVIGGIVVMFEFLNVTMATGTQRFLTFQLGKKNFKELKKTFSTALIIHIFLALVILILAETIGLWFLNYKMNIPADRMYAAQWVFQFSVFASLVSIVQVPYNAIIIAHERMNIYAYVSILEVILKLLLLYLLLIVKYDKLIVYAILIFLVNTIVIMIYRIYCTRQYTECKFQLVHDKQMYKSMLSFSGWNIFGCMAATGANQGINILLNLFFGPAVNAARAISYQVSNAINGFNNNFQTAVTPQITKLYAENKITDLHTLLFQNAKFVFLLLYLISLPVLFELNILLFWWLKVVPENTLLFCRIILVHSLIYSTTRPFIMAIHATGKMKFLNLTAGISLLMVLPISYLSLKLGAPSYTPFIIYIIGTIVEFSFELYILNKYINLSFIDFLKKTIIPISKVSLISIILPTLVIWYLDAGLMRLALIILTSSICILFSSYFIAIDHLDRIKVRTYLMNRIQFSRK